MAYIKQLIQSLFDQESEGNIESFKKLIYLAVNEPNIFTPHALQLANILCPILHCIQDTTTKIYALQLLAQLATNYKQRIAAQIYDFKQIVSLLSDENAEVRKAAHYLLLTFIKKYEKIDEVIKGYLLKLRENPDQWKQIQKIIHSFQSLLVIEPKCITYPNNFNLIDDLLRLVIAFRSHQHALIQKASQQTAASFVKNEYAPKVLPKLDKVITNELMQLAEKLGISMQIKVQQAKVEVGKPKKAVSELQKLMEVMQQQTDWKVKSQIIEQISKLLQTEPPQSVTESFVDQMLDYTYDYNFKICITAMNIVHTLVMRCPMQIKQRTRRIEEVMIEKVCDLKMAVRQIAAKILKRIFNNQNKESMKRMLNKLNNCSVVGKEQILTFFQEYYSTVIPFDLNMILSEIATQLSNENTKIKIKTLDCLVKICLNSNLEESKYILQKKLNKVYYDMFLERLKERNMPQTKSERWEDAKNNNINKGMTWQAERSPNLADSQNNRFMTKVQFAKKVDKNPSEDTFTDFKYEAPTFGGLGKKEVKQDRKDQKVMLGTSHTTNKTESVSQYQKPEEMSETPNSKIIKRGTESYRSSATANSINKVDDFQAQEKKLPLKPKPVKKVMTAQQSLQQENTNLVIRSKEYQNKNTIDDFQEQKLEVKPEKFKQMKLAKPKQQKIQKPFRCQQQKPTETIRSQKEPFSIKKAASKKQHQIDYKATQYISKEELAPVANPKELLKQLTVNISKDNDWSKQFDSLDAIRRLIKNHQDFYPQIHQNLQTIMPEVLKLVESLRSSLAKNAMITLAEMCEAFKKAMDPFLEAIFVKLFKKAQDTNTFIIEEVNKCVKSLCYYCSTSKIGAVIINNSQAKATPIKLKVALCLQRLFEKDSFNVVLLKENPKILGVMNGYIADSSQQVRSLTRQIFISIHQNNSLPQVQGIFRKSPKQIWQKWRSIIDRDLK